MIFQSHYDSGEDLVSYFWKLILLDCAFVLSSWCYHIALRLHYLSLVIEVRGGHCDVQQQKSWKQPLCMDSYKSLPSQLCHLRNEKTLVMCLFSHPYMKAFITNSVKWISVSSFRQDIHELSKICSTQNHKKYCSVSLVLNIIYAV